MDENIKNSIKARKEAFTNAYIIEDQSLLKMIDDLFNKINEFGTTCRDVMDFETKFAISPLNQEYIDLFTKIATTSKPIIYESNEDVKSDAEYLKDEIMDDLKYASKEITRPVRRNIKAKLYDKVRDIPGVSQVMLAKQYHDLGKSITGGYQNDDEEDENETE
ncbi:MAG: hypothetical protein J5892_01295 [Bacilli bacterium]|nr:hypothetical protein [Bacilli bacterium]